MNLEVEEEREDVLELKLEDANEAIANSLRRAMMAKVPTLATKEIHVTKNESAMFNEMLANRIGQIPLTIPKNIDEEDEVKLSLKKEGPTTVLGEDLQAANDEVEAVNPETEIVDLKEGQGIELEGTAVLGKGKDHAKHQGGTIGYEKTGEGEFNFRIESTSGYSNKELFKEAVDLIQEELDELEEEIA
ncbi:MAG: hypothetical protein ABEI78_01465 [Candidatus Nanohaloarchaea archaeon]